MPLTVMFLTAIGLGSILRGLIINPEKRGLYLLLILWPAIPILRVSVPKARDFDVIRHWLEFLPALAVVAGLGANTLFSGLKLLLGRLKNGIPNQFLTTHQNTIAVVLIVLYLSPVIVWNTDNHPFQLVYYNDLAGRLKGAQGRGWPGATDYWGSSYRSGLKWLNAHAPSDSILFVGVAQHIVAFVEQIRLRKDIELRNTNGFYKTLESSDDSERPVYMMYINRQRHYTRILRQIDGEFPVVHRINVDGGTILKILKIR